MGRTFAVSDLHGRLDLYKQICNFLKPDDKVFFLGDACDRGDDGWELIKEILRNEQWVYLKGNHEDMLIKAVEDYLKDDAPRYSSYNLVVMNGGAKTLEDAFGDSFLREWINMLKRNLKLWEEYENSQGLTIYLTHAGFTPNYFVDADGEPLFIPDEDLLLWDRKHFKDKWDEETEKKTICVHGHTPLPYLADDLHIKREEIEPGALWYCNDHKVCIDNLSAYSDVACLLDLDTFDEHIFEVKK